MSEVQAEVQGLIDRARKAQRQIEFWSQEQVDEVVAAVGWQLVKEEHVAACAKLAFEETQMGNYQNKVVKIRKKTLGTLRDLHDAKTVGMVEEDEAKGIRKFAKPVGTIGALTPCTNPTSTLCTNGLAALKTRNAIIFSPHPRAKRAATLTTEYMRAGLRKVGAPEDLCQVISQPSIEKTEELMASVDLVVATGGSPMVKAAYSSGTPAYGVGPGNSTIIVDESADIGDAAHKTFLSKTFDYATSCSSDNNNIVHEDIYDRFVAELKTHSGHICTAEEKEKLRQALWPDGIHLSPKIIAQPASTIAEVAGIRVPEGTAFFMVEGQEPVVDDLFAREKLCVVGTLWKYRDFTADAIRLVNQITSECGYGHSCGIHSFNEDHINELATAAHVSRMMVRQVQVFGNSGAFDNGMPVALTLGCGTWGNNATSSNVDWTHFLNYTWVSTPIPLAEPDPAVLFGAHWEKYGQ